MPISKKKIKKEQRRKKLPARWQRTFRPETVKHPDLEREERLSVDHNRKSDRKFSYAWGSSSLEKVQKELKFDISAHIKTAFASARFTSSQPFKVIELGCGKGLALRSLKQQFGDRIKTVGLVLEKTPGFEYEGIDKLHTGELRYLNPHEKYDFIYSEAGSIFNSAVKRTAIEKVIELLKPGGTAVVDVFGLANALYQVDPKMLREHLSRTTGKSQNPKSVDAMFKFYEEGFGKMPNVLNEILTVLRQNGIRPEKVFSPRIGVISFIKPKPRLPK